MPVPSTPLLTLAQATTAGNLGSNQLSFGFQSGTPICTIFRLSIEGELICLTRTLESGEVFKDFNIKPDVAYDYYGHSTNGSGDSPQSNIVRGTLSFSTGILHEVRQVMTNQSNNATASNAVIEIFNQEGQRDARTREGNIWIMPDNAKPIITTSPLLGRSLSIPILIPNSSISVLQTLKTAMQSNALYCYRDGLGTHLFGTFPDQEIVRDLNGVATIIMRQSRYFEHVEAAA